MLLVAEREYSRCLACYRSQRENILVGCRAIDRSKRIFSLSGMQLAKQPSLTRACTIRPGYVGGQYERSGVPMQGKLIHGPWTLDLGNVPERELALELVCLVQAAEGPWGVKPELTSAGGSFRDSGLGSGTLGLGPGLWVWVRVSGFGSGSLGLGPDLWVWVRVSRFGSGAWACSPSGPMQVGHSGTPDLGSGLWMWARVIGSGSLG
jgi:hypothetical protein